MEKEKGFLIKWIQRNKCWYRKIKKINTHKHVKAIYIPSNLSTTVTLGTEESGRCEEVPPLCRGRGGIWQRKESTEAHVPTPLYGQYRTYAHNQITRAVAAMESCLALLRTHQYGIACTVSLAITDPAFYCRRGCISTPVSASSTFTLLYLLVGNWKSVLPRQFFFLEHRSLEDLISIRMLSRGYFGSWNTP